MKTLLRAFGVALRAAPLALVLLASSGVVPQSAALAEDSLYKRLGGYDAIAAVTDDFVGRLLKDDAFSRFFKGFSTDSKKRVRQEIVDFFCEKTGGPCIYRGRDMKTSHAGIGITKAEWDRSIGLFGETLKSLHVPEAESKALAALVLPLERDIVETK